jgi:HSP20 family molecular chaperone IbpA
MCNRQSFDRSWNHHHGHRYGAHRGRHGWKARYRSTFSSPPANVLETDDAYELQLFAPGFEKSDFIIGLADGYIDRFCRG